MTINRPTSAMENTGELISRAHTKILQLLGDLRNQINTKNATAVLAILVGAGSANAQTNTVPRVIGPNQSHTQILGPGELPKPHTVTGGGSSTVEKGGYTITSSVGTSSPSAPLQATKGLEYGQITNDGRKFESLTEKEVDGLSDPEYDRYQKWKLISKNAKVITGKEEGKKLDQAANTINSENEGKKQIINTGKEEGKKLDQAANTINSENEGKKQALIAEYRKTLANFVSLYSSGKTDSDAFKGLKESLLKILDNGQPEEIVVAIKKDKRIEQAIRA